MPNRSDYSEHPSILPLPELSPTLNPVLGQNMGRWAEVYFTSPPEKREEAVLELLRTLEAENPMPDESKVDPALDRKHPAEPLIAGKGPEVVECQSCGRKNPAQRFCGMCGARLELVAAPDPQMDEPSQSSLGTAAESAKPQLFVQEQEFEESVLTRGELASFEAERERDSSDYFLSRFSDSGRPSDSRRLYIGGVLAILIVAFAYVAWRGKQATSGSSQVTPQVQTEVTKHAEAPVATPNVPTAALPTNSSVTPPSSTETGTSTKKSVEKAAPTAFVTAAARSTIPEAPAISGGGSEELAAARRYLKGTDGQKQDTTQAVDWLWKAVAKRNIEATLLLSDLFLKGSGVPQNCDQGRVLLDAAASRGSKDAAVRLRHLQAFGCQ